MDPCWLGTNLTPIASKHLGTTNPFRMAAAANASGSQEIWNTLRKTLKALSDGNLLIRDILIRKVLQETCKFKVKDIWISDTSMLPFSTWWDGRSCCRILGRRRRRHHRCCRSCSHSSSFPPIRNGWLWCTCLTLYALLVDVLIFLAC